MDLSQLENQSPIAPLWLLKDRNLMVSSLMIAVVSMAMFGLTTQQTDAVGKLAGLSGLNHWLINGTAWIGVSGDVNFGD